MRLAAGLAKTSAAFATSSGIGCTTTSMSNKEGERRPIQCFVQQKTTGSQEVITIQMPAFDWYTRSGQAATLSPSDDTSLTMPILTSARGNRRRARFSHAEEDL
jgi:hypothetical protein